VTAGKLAAEQEAMRERMLVARSLPPLRKVARKQNRALRQANQKIRELQDQIQDLQEGRTTR
jgi:hypothetical protein